MLSYTVFEKSASAEWVTFIHGAGGSSSIWYKQIRDFKKEYNLLLIDLRGHGDSKDKKTAKHNEVYTFNLINSDIIEVLDFVKIRNSHFVGISLGTILIRQLAETHPERVNSMILGGAILKFNVRSRFLIQTGNLLKNVVPYMFLYKLFAFVIMPRKNHKHSRLLFINEAKKIYQREFIRWFKLTNKINPLLKFFRGAEVDKPTFYLMGAEDYLFLPYVQAITKRHTTSSKLYVIENCGHVVNIERAQVFNMEVLSYLKGIRGLSI